MTHCYLHTQSSTAIDMEDVIKRTRAGRFAVLLVANRPPTVALNQYLADKVATLERSSMAAPETKRMNRCACGMVVVRSMHVF